MPTAGVLMMKFLLKKDGIFYEIIVLERGVEAAFTALECEIGPRLLEQRPPLFKNILLKYAVNIKDAAEYVPQCRSKAK